MEPIVLIAHGRVNAVYWADETFTRLPNPAMACLNAEPGEIRWVLRRLARDLEPVVLDTDHIGSDVAKAVAGLECPEHIKAALQAAWVQATVELAKPAQPPVELDEYGNWEES